MQTIDTLVIGGGQAGLATSRFLQQHQIEHLILEQSMQAAHAWRNDRWDSFALLTPNWTLQMPGAEYRGDDPDGFLPREQIVAYFENYIGRFNLPVQYGMRVTSITARDAGLSPISRSFRPARSWWRRACFNAQRSPPLARTSRTGYFNSIRVNIAIPNPCLRARYWSSARRSRAARSRRSYIRADAWCICAWEAQGARRAVTADGTFSPGCTNSVSSTAPWINYPRPGRSLRATRISPAGTADTPSTCTSSRATASTCWDG